MAIAMLPRPEWARTVDLDAAPGACREILGTSKKTKKSETVGVLSRVVYLAPSTESGRWNLCPHASPACAAACLGHSAGRMHTPDSWNARRRRTWALMTDRAGFVRQLCDEAARHARRAARRGMVGAVRPNGSSDVPWERVAPRMFETVGIRWYDYTKDPARMRAFLAGRLPATYHLTFSRDERPETERAALRFLAQGGTVAVVFERLPGTWKGFPVVDGDAHDARFLDAPGTVVGLVAKGAARRDQSGFVVR